MRNNILKVLEAFARSEAYAGLHISTNGRSLYSYNCCIAYRNTRGDVVLLETERALSATTRSHIRAAEKHFGKVVRFQKDEF